MGGLVAVLLVAIEIHASGDCPAAADVERRLAPLLEGGAARIPDVATIRHGADGSLRVALDDSAGRSIGDRRFPRAATCDDQAETVAVTLAIWEAQMHPEISLRLDRLSPQAVPAAPPPEVRIVAPPSPPPTRAVLFLGAAAAGDWQPGSWAPAGRIELGVGRQGGRWRARLAAMVVGRHALDVAPGQARWWRGAASLGADYDAVLASRWVIAIGAGALVGVASISGEGFTLDRTSRSVDAGGELRVRAQRRSGRVRPWVGASLTTWMRRQALDLEGAASSSALPRVEPAVAAGADFVW
jgi:hypothetical protein